MSNRGPKKARAVYDYQGERASDLSFRAGDIINVISESSPSGPDWWEGELFGKRGPFPLNHVEIMSGNGTTTSPTTSGPGFVEPKIGKPKRPELFLSDHIAWKISLGFSVFATVAMLIALIMTWYFITFPNVRVREFQFLGVKNYQENQLNNPAAVLTKQGDLYDTYGELGWNGMKNLHLLSLILVLVAFIIQFVISILLFLRVRDILKTVFYLPFFSLVSFVLILIAPINYALKITNLVATEVLPNTEVNDPDSFGGPRVAFFGTRVTQVYVVGGTVFGNAGTQKWGPTASWAFAVIAIAPAFATYMALFLIVLGRRVICCGNKLKG